MAAGVYDYSYLLSHICKQVLIFRDDGNSSPAVILDKGNKDPSESRGVGIEKIGKTFSATQIGRRRSI